MKRLYNTILVFIVSAPAALAQRNVIHQEITWTGFVLQYKGIERWSYVLDADKRQFHFPYQHNTFMARASFRYALGKLPLANTSVVGIGGGFSHFRQGSNRLPDAVNLIIPEWRSHIQADIENTSAKKLIITHRYRGELRMFQKANDTMLLNGFRSVIRLRYRFGLDIALGKKDKPKFKLRLADEVMVNVGKQVKYNVFDQNRLCAGLLYKWSRDFSTELTYMSIYLLNANGVDLFERDVLRLQLIYTYDRKLHTIIDPYL